jgi:hypothetical protein
LNLMPMLFSPAAFYSPQTYGFNYAGKYAGKLLFEILNDLIDQKDIAQYLIAQGTIRRVKARSDGPYFMWDRKSLLPGSGNEDLDNLFLKKQKGQPLQMEMKRPNLLS